MEKAGKSCWEIANIWLLENEKGKAPKLFTMTFANCSTLCYGSRAHTREQSRQIERGSGKKK
jgi:hypothetical protein